MEMTERERDELRAEIQAQLDADWSLGWFGMASAPEDVAHMGRRWVAKWVEWRERFAPKERAWLLEDDGLEAYVHAKAYLTKLLPARTKGRPRGLGGVDAQVQIIGLGASRGAGITVPEGAVVAAARHLGIRVDDRNGPDLSVPRLYVRAAAANRLLRAAYRAAESREVAARRADELRVAA